MCRQICVPRHVRANGVIEHLDDEFDNFWNNNCRLYRRSFRDDGIMFCDVNRIVADTPKLSSDFNGGDYFAKIVCHRCSAADRAYCLLLNFSLKLISPLVCHCDFNCSVEVTPRHDVDGVQDLFPRQFAGFLNEATNTIESVIK